MHYVYHTINHIIANWGYLAVFVMLAAEGFGLFFLPGETTLTAAAVEAGKTGNLDIAALIAVAFCGAILGDNFAFQVGKAFGFRLLRGYGHMIGVNEKRLKFMQYLYLRRGKPIVFVGRFVTLLRSWESLLAGANAMPWREFFPVNALASLLWVCVWGLGAYGLGQASTGLLERLAIGIFVVFAILIFIGWLYFRRHEDALEAKAEEALPGPLKARRATELREAGKARRA